MAQSLCQGTVVSQPLSKKPCASLHCCRVRVGSSSACGAANPCAGGGTCVLWTIHRDRVVEVGQSVTLYRGNEPSIGSMRRGGAKGVYHALSLRGICKDGGW